ncbi:hypothetical protein [Abyssalbus ytuae]|uniref:Uncharacterized protein n=1 Tax=Abyssalbus ytuae TaxID=2926907 RepID=A0A9E6ZNQ7_9FLAO|nr:hypothetical protein [Abyssalbus ytuae]UOB19262.1 hypothetical protein MQE35_08165 [Abyssalbus ytuae]
MFKDKNLWVALTVIVVSMLPFIHDMIQLGPGEFLGFSSRRVFLYMVAINVFSHIGWILAFFLAKDKPYRFSLLVPVSLSLYNIIILVTGLKDTGLNEATTKFFIVMILSTLLIIKYFRNKNNERSN